MKKKTLFVLSNVLVISCKNSTQKIDQNNAKAYACAMITFIK